MSDYYEWIRALHIIAVIFWMAGMLYLPRLYVYHSGAKIGGELDETLKIQERRLLRIIINPAMIIAFILGSMLVHIRWEAVTGTVWLPVKLAAVFLLFAYHGVLAGDRKKFERGERPRSQKFYRMFNEIPPILTIIIVIMAVVEPF